MKLAIAGKGGVGKTTVSALLARGFVNAGHQVVVIDADSNPSLASCLGFPAAESITPLNEMADLIEERTGAKPGVQGGMFKINPRVEDIPERFSVTHDGICLLRMGSVKAGGAGCYCAENVLLKNLVSHLLLNPQDVLIMDMEAGVENLTRGTAQGVDWLVEVIEPTRQSIETAKRIQALAADIGLNRIAAIGNKCRDKEEKEFLIRSIAPIPLLGIIPYDDAVRLAERKGRPPGTASPGIEKAVRGIVESLLPATQGVDHGT